MDVNADLRQLSSAELLLLLHNIWVELHNRLNFQPAASTNPEPENPGFTEESFVPHSCDQYCDWCRRLGTKLATDITLVSSTAIGEDEFGIH